MRSIFQMPETMIKTKEVRARVGIDRRLISLYRKAGLFPYDPIAIRGEGFETDRVYPAESLTLLNVLEGLRKRGFTISKMKVLFHTMAITEGTRDYISFDDSARLVIAPEGLAKAKAIIEAVVSSYDSGWWLPPGGN
ncbi:hypothetical protein ES705_34318 [subsurface metagenome]